MQHNDSPPIAPDHSFSSSVIGGVSLTSLLAILFTVMMAVQLFDKPSFCHDLDCPPFEVLETLPIGNIELRAYPTTTWVSTNVTDTNYDRAVGTGFMRLFKYISGANMGEEKIPMTAPVVVDVVPGPGPTCGTEFTVSFYSPTPTPPDPLSKLLTINTYGPASYYVLSYGGWATEAVVLSKAKELADALTSLGKSFDSAAIITAGYDSPFRLLHRHNEIAFAAVE